MLTLFLRLLAACFGLALLLALCDPVSYTIMLLLLDSA